MTEQPPELWSDFDGTAVKKYSIKNPARWLQNSLKYPLPGLHGYAEFLAGVEAGGVAIGGVVSKRPDIFPRRWVTALSISQLGLKEFFGRDGQVILAGRESAKGRFVASRTRESVVGVIDDQPQNFVPALVDGLLAEANNGAEFGVAVVGVVDHPRSRERIEGYATRNTLATYVHVHLASQPFLARRLVMAAKEVVLVESHFLVPRSISAAAVSLSVMDRAEAGA